MRMWKVNPKLLCDKHLLGEHVEMHMFTGCLAKGKSIQGYIDKGLVELDKIEKRHNELADEMIRRGMKHNSPLLIEVVADNLGKVDIAKSIRDLCSRCEDCNLSIKLNLK